MKFLTRVSSDAPGLNDYTTTAFLLAFVLRTTRRGSTLDTVWQHVSEGFTVQKRKILRFLVRSTDPCTETQKVWIGLMVATRTRNREVEFLNASNRHLKPVF